MKVLKIIGKILSSIIVIPFCIMSMICMILMTLIAAVVTMIYLVFATPYWIYADIWGYDVDE